MSDKISDIEAKLKANIDSREKADLLNELSWELRLSDPRRGLEAAIQSTELSQRLSYQRGTANGLCYCGVNRLFLSEYDQAIGDLEQALKIYEAIGDTDGQATAFNWLGNNYHKLGDYQKSLQCHLESIKRKKEINDLKGEAGSFVNIGNIYLVLGDYDACLEYYFKALNINEKLESKYGIAISMGNIGLVYDALGDYAKALEFHSKSYRIAREIGNRHGEMASFENIGDILLKQKDYDDALEHLLKGLKISEELEEYHMRVGLLRGIGTVYQILGENDNAVENYLKGLKISRQVGLKENEQSMLLSLGKYYEALGNTEESLMYLGQSLCLAEELKSKPQLSETFLELSEIYRRTGDHQKALDCYQKYHETDKALFNESSDKKRQASMIKFQVEQKEKEAEIYRLRNVELAEANQAITQAKEIIEEKNRHITSSIEYARRIQQAVLPPAGKMQAALPEHFVLFKPRDIVSGDFYWFSQTGGKILIAVVDCTGHGVPGAFMSMIGSMLLNTIVNENGEAGPANILAQLHVAVRSALKQHDAEADTTDGMDVCLCAIEQKAKQLVYAGAKRPLYLVRNTELTEIAGDGKSIGGRQKEEKRAFSDKQIELQDDDMIYLTSDGYSDQCDPEGRKIGSRRLKELLVEISGHDTGAQREALLAELEQHQGGEEQRDDIAVVGVKIGG